MTTPYRTTMLTPPVDTSPPWWQRAWFRVARDDAAQRWQWARRAIGGRWCRMGDHQEMTIERVIESCAHGINEARRMGYESDTPRGRAIADAIIVRDYGRHEWRIVDRCPGEQRYDVRAWRIRGECYAGHCICEVWP
jgi:hypothetical protein